MTAASVALGQADEPGVATRVDPCVPIDLGRFHRLLGIELGAAIEYLADNQEARSPVKLSLTCVPSGIQVLLEDAVTRKSMTRIVDLERVQPQSRSRLMALTVAEFVVASWLELRLAKQAVVEPVGPAPPSALERAASRVVELRLPATSAGAWQLDATGDLMKFATASRLIPCFSLRLGHPLSGAFALAVGVQVGHEILNGSLLNASLEPGPVRVQLTTTSLVASVLYTGRIGDFDASAGIGARIGFAYLKAMTAAANLVPRSSSAQWGGPAVVLGSGYRAGPHLRIVANVEAGAVVVGTLIEAPPHQVIARLEKGWIAVSLGAGWLF